MFRLSGWLLERVKRDYETQGHLSTVTSLGGWALYLIHAVLTLGTSRRSRGSLPIGNVGSATFGGSLILSGLGLYRAGMREFRSFEQASGLEAGNLVTSGPYRYSRNPQILGWLLMLAGVALAYRSVQGISLVAAFLFVHRLYFEIEEQHLERIFGEEYRRYKAEAPRFLGLPSNGSDDR